MTEPMTDERLDQISYGFARLPLQIRIHHHIPARIAGLECTDEIRRLREDNARRTHDLQEQLNISYGLRSERNTLRKVVETRGQLLKECLHNCCRELPLDLIDDIIEALRELDEGKP
jgi:RNase adaptor protein for sRNA GlmZ degradation